MDMKASVYDMLRKKGYRVTRQKKAILDILFNNAERMLSVSEIEALILKECDIDNATVYRNVQGFLKLGILESMIDSNGVSRYTICDSAHHHHLICTECGKIIKFHCNNQFWEDFAKEKSFKESYHKLEVYGKCLDCQKP